MTQTQALNILKTGKNTFVTGPAGSGKTFVINAYIKYLKDHRVPIGVTASTGIAATHMGGVTIHSWSGIGIKDSLDTHDLHEISERAQVRRKIEESKVLFIDEVSMLHHFRLDLVDRVLRHIKKNEDPFGGIQVVLCGDFFQLPPVSRLGEPESRFIYDSDSWKRGNFTICYLEENYRQGTDESVEILNDIRSGEVSERSRGLLKSRYVVNNESGSLSQNATISIIKKNIIEPTRLYTHNIDVDHINTRELKKISGTETVYEMISKGRKSLLDSLKKSCLAPEMLRLKKGARVMCVKNNFEEGYVNGTLGVVVSCGWGIDPVIHTAPTLDYPQGRKITIRIAEWTIEDDGRILAQISQYPLRLAWAITIHKSQGMSLDAVEVDLTKSFEPGMGYVALSRARTLAGLSILGMNDVALKVHSEVLEHDLHLRELSRRAESVIEYTDNGEIKRVHETFLANVAPLHSAGKRINGKNQNSKISTFEKTALMIKNERSLKDIALERGLSTDTIIHHLEKLIEIGPDDGGIVLSDIQYLKNEISAPHWAKTEKALAETAERDERDRTVRSKENIEYKPPLLSVVKNRIKGFSSFKDIRLARVILGYIKRR